MHLHVHYRQHVPLRTWGPSPSDRPRRPQVGRTRLYAGDPLPRPDTLDLLIVMRGPMGVHDGDACPWIGHHLRLVWACIEAGVRRLGDCRRAQLIASTLGRRGPPSEPARGLLVPAAAGTGGCG
jgi:hypothetical protein